MKATAEENAANLTAHLEDCAAFRDRIEKKLSEAEVERREMAFDIKKLLAFMHKALGFLKALAVIGGVVGTMVALAGLLK